GTCRSPGRAQRLQALGTEPIVLDLLDSSAVRKAVADTRPDAIIHQATALAGLSDVKSFDRSFTQTNRLRTAGTDALLAAARQAGIRRFLARATPATATRARADRSRPKTTRSTRLPYQRCARPKLRWTIWTRRSPARAGSRFATATSTATPTTAWSRPCARKFPIGGDGGGVWAFTPPDDAPPPTLPALDHDGPGICNIVDDEPAPTSVWPPELAKIIGARPP